jgi:hypothetical protein
VTSSDASNLTGRIALPTAGIHEHQIGCDAPLFADAFSVWIVEIALQRPHTFIMLAVLIVFMGVSAGAERPVDIRPRRDLGRDPRKRHCRRPNGTHDSVVPRQLAQHPHHHPSPSTVGERSARPSGSQAITYMTRAADDNVVAYLDMPNDLRRLSLLGQTAK